MFRGRSRRIEPMPPSVLIQVDENPNCESMDGLVFQPKTAPQPIRKIRMERAGIQRSCNIIGLNEDGTTCSAMACLIDDSGDGACFLIFGGPWGLRFKIGDCEWDLADPE